MTDRVRRIVAALAAASLLIALVWHPAVGKAPEPSAAGLREEAGRRVVGLGMHDTRVVDQVFEAARVRDVASSATWSTDVAGYTGTLLSDPFALGTDLRLPVLGSLTAGNVLRLWIFAPDGVVWHQLTCDVPAGGERVALWNVDTRRWAGGTARIALEDGRDDAAGWLGIGVPVVWVRPDPRVTTYGQFAVALLIVAALVLAPGLALTTAFPRLSLWRLLLPLPGLLTLAVFGALLWLAGISGDPTAGRVYVVFNLLLALSACRRGTPADDDADGSAAAWPLALWCAASATAVLLGVNPLPVEGEFFVNTSLPGRMVESPGDHLIPFRTAAYFYHRHDGRVLASEYFWDWGLCARGPLVPFAVNTLFAVCQPQPGDPPELDRAHWPLADDGAYLASLLGWLTNAMVILGAARLLRTLAVGPVATTLTLAWLTLAPVTLINVVYLWPKLLAAFFLLLAVADLIEARRARAGVFAALAWLSHPVGALYSVPLGLLAAHLGWRAAVTADWSRPAWHGLRAGLVLGGSTLAVMGPWLAFKVWLNQPDPFASYLMGDGHTFTPAKSVASWLYTRWSNLWYTLAPGAFFAAGQMRVWLDVVVNEPVRWTVQYAKTLPAQLGFSFFAIGYLAMLRRASPRVQLLKLHLVGSALVVMLVFWGFSSDGLGRASLEPLSVMVIALAGAWFGEQPPRWAVPALIALAGEGAWIVVTGMFAGHAFSLALASFLAWVLAVASLVPSALVVWGTVRRLRACRPV